MKQADDVFVRAGRGGREDLRRRVPELRPLGEKTIAVFGLGCLGAPSAIEFARAGVRELRVLDGDAVDVDTICRWPLGFSVAGRRKVEVMRDFVAAEYPYTRVVPFDRRLGGVTLGPRVEASDRHVLSQVLSGASLIYDATAEPGVQNFLSDLARELDIPYVAVDATQGGWGGRICRVTGSTPGCWSCFQAALGHEIPVPPADEQGTLQPEGCGDPTFTGANFDLMQIASAGVRTAIATLCAGTDGAYPGADWDVTVVSLRSADGKLIPPKFDTYALERHAACPRCGVRE